MTKQHKNQNAPYIREIIDRTATIGGQRIEGQTKDEMRRSLNSILEKQFERAKSNARAKTY